MGSKFIVITYDVPVTYVRTIQPPAGSLLKDIVKEAVEADLGEDLAKMPGEFIAGQDYTPTSLIVIYEGVTIYELSEDEIQDIYSKLPKKPVDTLTTM